ncbi:MAG TPA: nitrite/sulfite reductase [Burkholderiales bacterium]|jgi:sulfite reductase (NADPH) hemoprotein beta-component|nr:nitrite/sulfite reductase [Burkholderiales bacterium]
MYAYDRVDRALVAQRVAQYRDQVRRFLAGELTEDEFRPLRLQNGLYLQKHAPMLRVAIPYGVLSAHQMRTLAGIARRYDRGYGHFSTRQNLQFNWPRLEDTPDILAELAAVQMHAIQTSGNCVRNITTDEFAGVAPDEIADPRPFCEILRQWSTFHPEFSFLPRKFKIAINASEEDRSATAFHDIGLYLRRAPDGELGMRVSVGGGMGRTPMLGAVIREFLPWRHMTTYVEAILRVYNRYGRRDNLFKARIKILVKAIGATQFARQVEDEWALIKDGPGTLTEQELARVSAFFLAPDYLPRADHETEYLRRLGENRAFARWAERAVRAHRVPGYRAVVLSLKKTGVPPGDATAEQMERVADWSERFGFGEIRVSHEQNLILPDVRSGDLHALWREAREAGLATPNPGLLTDIIACPGGDFCSLANARSIPVAEAIQRRFEDLDYLHDIGELNLNISGCMNSCGHHHAGHIGILGVDKDGEEWYQVSIGGADGSRSSGARSAIGKVIGPSFKAQDMPDVVARLIDVYLAHRQAGERFIDTVERVGIAPFKAGVYGTAAPGRAVEAGREVAADA